jgi:PAS domain S-box-containing protein
MDPHPKESAEEIRRLQRCINDLIGVLALPAMWSGAEPPQVVHTLLDALLGMLELDLVYVRLTGPAGHAPVEMVRFAQSSRQQAPAHQIGAELKRWLAADPQQWPLLLRAPLAGLDLSIVPLGLGMQGEIGVLVAASERVDFPQQTERLILSVAANQAFIGLQEARLLSEQKHVASELDRRVAQRTAELAAANEELRREIADRRHAEEELRSSEEKHRVIVEAANDAVISMDDNGIIQFANPATGKIFGYDPAELMGKPMTVLMPGRMRELHDLGFRRYLTTGRRQINWQGTELIAVRRSGQEFPAEVSFGEQTRDGHKIFTGFIRDISERKLAEDKIRASERNLSLIIETIPGLVWCAAPDGQFNYLNRRILNYAGTSSDAWAQLGWTSFLHPNDAELTLQSWSRAVETGEPYDTQCRLRRSDGVYRWFRALGQAARDMDGQVTRWYGLLIDIDDGKNLAEALRDSQTRLSRATRTATVGEFAAAIAHEINQPLAAVVTNGEACLNWLSTDPPNLGKTQEAAMRIVRDGKEAGEVVRRIRALFKKVSVEKVELDLNEVIAEVLHLLSGETAKRLVAVETDLAGDLPPVAGDRVQLQQVVFNLLLNGIEAMDSISGNPRKLFIRTKLESPEKALVEIRDSGAGLEDSEKIFETFFTTKENGMGMGLAVCRSIVDAHHGRLWAESRRGESTTFSFVLPVQAGVAS